MFGFWMYVSDLKHFKDSHFNNLCQYKEGFADRLRLNERMFGPPGVCGSLSGLVGLVWRWQRDDCNDRLLQYYLQWMSDGDRGDSGIGHICGDMWIWKVLRKQFMH
ncbi:hypothetical protein F2P79_019778 [Pimephales promelas]|nr:hypothetical protein F2P79_019778 [Pimephales promelas]